MRIYNTLTRRKEEFIPLEEGKVKMYVCGPTVYNHLTVGNVRPMVVFDTVRRYLEHKGYAVQYVQNFTDVDDKIIKRAAERNMTAAELSLLTITDTLEDAKNLHVKPPTAAPLVTEEMHEIIRMIGTLLEKGYAYEKNGTVFFDTEKYDGYGKLSKKNIDELMAGARIEVDGEKKSPMDFVLWKPAKPGEPKWESPWGRGRPGWHIECSAMARKYLGDTIDIHAGGEDLVFPHHENEIAQSECANGVPFVRYWMHNGFLNDADNKKMSKSKGNFFTLREVAEKYSYDTIRFFFLSSHYRSPVQFGDTLLMSAESGLNRIKNCAQNLHFLLKNATIEEMMDREKNIEKALEAFSLDFDNAMDDDFNTADALSAIFELVRTANGNVSEQSSGAFLRMISEKLHALCGIMGLRLGEAPPEQDMLEAEIQELIEARQKARADRDFKAADAIRKQLADRGITLEDTRQGVRWTRMEPQER